MRTTGQIYHDEPRLAGFTRVVGEWATKTFPGEDSYDVVSHLEGEALELSVALLGESKTEIAEELADVILLALVVAHHEGVDVEKAILDKFAVNQARKWAKDDNGFWHHVEDEG